MSDQTACAFEKLQVFVIEGIQFIALRVEHPENVPVIVAHRHNDLGTGCMKRRQIPDILAHVAHDDGFTGIQRSSTQALANWETWVGRWVAAGFGHDHKLVFNDLVNPDPTIVARGANHLHELVHSFARAPASQRKTANLLKLLTGGFFHSRETNVDQNKTSASRISTFCRESLLKDDVGTTGISPDGWSIKQFATIDGVRILAKDFAMCCSRGRGPSRDGGTVSDP